MNIHISRIFKETNSNKAHCLKDFRLKDDFFQCYYPILYMIEVWPFHSKKKRRFFAVEMTNCFEVNWWVTCWWANGFFFWPTAHEQCVDRSCGLMDKAPDFGSGDCRFESCHDRFIFSSYFFLYILKARFCDHTYVSNQIEMMKYIYVYHVSWCPMHRNCLWTSNANSIDSLASLSFLHTGRTIIQIWT